MEGVLPAFVVVCGLELCNDIVTVLPEFQMKSDGVGGAANKAVVALSPDPGVYYLAHNFSFIGRKITL